MKNLKLANKIFLLGAVTAVVFALTMGVIYSTLKKNLYAGKREELKFTIESSHGVINHFATLGRAGSITEEQARQAAKEAIRATGFDSEHGNYFFILDTQGAMVMHPKKPALEGKMLLGVKDPAGTYLFADMVKVVKNSGEGYVNYVWDKPGFQQPVEKLSFVKEVPEWGWIVGAGLYLDDIQAEMARAFYIVAGGGLVFLLVTGVFSIVVARSISIPMGRAVEMIEGLGKGELDSRLQLDQRDEIGRLAKALDAFADSLQFEILTAFRKLADGDFTFKAQGLIREPLAEANASLNEVMAQIRVAGSQIAAGSSQISDTSQSLSHGATESASSIEEISSSVEQMSAQTNLNAENASEADRLVTHTREAVERGNGQMTMMIEAMGEINEAGQNISKIIKTIDEIAFQTNLLALNAAVEAARAGQHGKGFAVVAEEVRSLAGRSAEAAKETAELIEGSVSKTEKGTMLADQTGVALTEILEGVGQVSGLVSEIAVASREQAQGLSQINIGLSQIDKVTQQNTASAEESAASAEELSSQAGQLEAMLSRFALEERGERLTFEVSDERERMPHVYPQRYSEELEYSQMPIY